MKLLTNFNYNEQFDGETCNSDDSSALRWIKDSESFDNSKENDISDKNKEIANVIKSSKDNKKTSKKKLDKSENVNRKLTKRTYR